MSAPWFILTATPKIRLELLPGELEARGIAVADPETVRQINAEILDSRGVTENSPLPSPSFRPDPEQIAGIAAKIGSLVENLLAPGVVTGTEFPLAIEDWAPAGPAAVFCLTSPEDPEIAEQSLACCRAFKIFDFHRLAASGVPSIFLNVEGMGWPEVASALAVLMGDTPPAIETEIDLDDSDLFSGAGRLPTGSMPFRVRADAPLSGLVVEELDGYHRRRIQQAALDDRAGLRKRAKPFGGIAG